MGDCKTIQEVIMKEHNNFLVGRAVNATNKLCSLLKILPQFNGLKTLQYARDTGVIVKWTDGEENVLDLNIENCQKFVEELYNGVNKIKSEKEEKNGNYRN